MAPEARPPLPVDRPPTAAWSTRQLALLLAITALATGLRLFRIELWSWSVAEAATWRAITLPFEGEAGFFSTAASNQPLGYLALRWLLDAGLLPGTGEGWLRLPFAFAGTLSVPLLAVLARGLIGNGPALVAALLLAIHPAHVQVSQSAHPLALALSCGLAGVTAAQRGRPWLAAGLLFAAGASDALGWSAALVAAAGACTRRWQLWLLIGAAVPAVPVLLLSLPCLSLPVLILAAVGLGVVRPLPRLQALGVVLPAAVACAFALADGRWGSGPWGSGTLASDIVVALPALLLLAAAAVARTYELASARLPVAWPLSHVLPALGAVAGIAWLAADTFLYATIQHGRRPPWRDAHDAVLSAADDGGALVVGAGVGAGILTCYLRPDHWRLPGDPHPGVDVVALDLRDAAAAMRDLVAYAEAGNSDPRQSHPARAVLVLHAGEQRDVTGDAAANAELAASFTLLYVVPGPRVTHDDTLWIYRSKPPR